MIAARTSNRRASTTSVKLIFGSLMVGDAKPANDPTAVLEMMLMREAPDPLRTGAAGRGS